MIFRYFFFFFLFILTYFHFPPLPTMASPKPHAWRKLLRKYYTAYDAKGKRIGFGRARHVAAPTRDELLVMAGTDEGHSARAPTMLWPHSGTKER